MPIGRATAYNTSYAMRAAEENMTNGIQGRKCWRQMLWTDGKTKMAQRSETHTNFQSGEGCKSAHTRLTTYAHYLQTSAPHNTHRHPQPNHRNSQTPFLHIPTDTNH